jgi:hypothetical protein
MADEGSVCADWYACRAFDSQIDRRFSLTYVDLHDPYAPQSRGSNKLPPKYGSNTHIPKAALIDPLNKKLYGSVTAMLTVTDVKAAAVFYQKAFGFAKRAIMNGPDGKAIHAELTLRGTTLMLGPEMPQWVPAARRQLAPRRRVCIY